MFCNQVVRKHTIRVFRSSFYDNDVAKEKITVSFYTWMGKFGGLVYYLRQHERFNMSATNNTHGILLDNGSAICVFKPLRTTFPRKILSL